MKKEYIKPEMLVEEFISDIHMMDSSSMPSEGPTNEFGANEHRGVWGNLWN